MSQAYAQPFTRTDRSPTAMWWWTLDRVTLTLVLVLLTLGFFFSFSSSPTAAEHIHIDDSLRFTKRHFLFAIASAGVTVMVSMLSLKGVRWVSLLTFAGAIFVMAILPFFGHSAKGSQRWIELGFITLQPSEFLKPALIVLVAWMFSASQQGKGIPGVTIAFGMYALSIFLLLSQPDVGQSFLITVVFGMCFFISGVPFRWILTLMVGAGAGLVILFNTVGHFRDRILKFLSDDKEDKFQVTRAQEAIANGHVFGQGINDGTMKHRLPDLHTDFIYSVVAEEYGLVISLALIAIFSVIVFRGLTKARQMTDPFQQTAAAGLTLMIGMQVLINVSVNLGIIPPKGMTLPFISYGGSSLLAMGLTMGLLLALTRRRSETPISDESDR